MNDAAPNSHPDRGVSQAAQASCYRWASVLARGSRNLMHR